MTFAGIDAWWWPYLFILIAGSVATDTWRFLGVYLGGRVSESSEILVLVRCIATALVASVIASLIVSPSGALATTPLALRLSSALAGFCAYLLAGRRVVAGILAAELVLITGWFLLPGPAS